MNVCRSWLLLPKCSLRETDPWTLKLQQSCVSRQVDELNAKPLISVFISIWSWSDESPGIKQPIVFKNTHLKFGWIEYAGAVAIDKGQLFLCVHVCVRVHVQSVHTLMPAFQSSVMSLSLSSSRFFWADATITWTSVVRTFSADAWTTQQCYSPDKHTIHHCHT